jgi:hypothetical protein
MMRIPAEIWRINPEEASKVITTTKEIDSFVLDPNEETSDIDTENNQYPRAGRENRFKKFKENQTQDDK